MQNLGIGMDLCYQLMWQLVVTNWAALLLFLICFDLVCFLVFLCFKGHPKASSQQVGRFGKHPLLQEVHHPNPIHCNVSSPRYAYNSYLIGYQSSTVYSFQNLIQQKKRQFRSPLRSCSSFLSHLNSDAPFRWMEFLGVEKGVGFLGLDGAALIWNGGWGPSYFI